MRELWLKLGSRDVSPRVGFNLRLARLAPHTDYSIVHSHSARRHCLPVDSRHELNRGSSVVRLRLPGALSSDSWQFSKLIRERLWLDLARMKVKIWLWQDWRFHELIEKREWLWLPNQMIVSWEKIEVFLPWMNKINSVKNVEMLSSWCEWFVRKVWDVWSWSILRKEIFVS